MKSTAPKIDKRSFQDLLQQMRAKVPFYTSEWKPTYENEAGEALLKIYLHMLQQTITRLNLVPDKNFLAFLDLLGIEILPAQSANAIVTFTLAEGTTEYVIVPKGTQLAGEGAEDGEEVIFETETDLRVSPSQIQEIFSIDASEDRIVSHTDQFINESSLTLFSGQNRQERSLYIGHADLLSQTNPAKIKIAFELADGAIAGALDLSWEYWNGERWFELEKFNFSESEEQKKKDETDLLNKSGEITIEKEQIGEFATLELYGRESRWLRCKLNNQLSALNPVRLPTVNTIRLTVAPIEPFSAELAFNNDIPLEVEERKLEMEVRENLNIELSFSSSARQGDQEIFLNVTGEDIQQGDFLKLNNSNNVSEIVEINKIEVQAEESDESKKCTLSKELKFDYEYKYDESVQLALDPDNLPQQGNNEIILDITSGELQVNDLVTLANNDNVREIVQIIKIENIENRANNFKKCTLAQELKSDHSENSTIKLAAKVPEVKFYTAVRVRDITLTLVSVNPPSEIILNVTGTDELQVGDFLKLDNGNNVPEVIEIQEIVNQNPDKQITLAQELKFDYSQNVTVELVTKVNVKPIGKFSTFNKSVFLEQEEEKEFTAIESAKLSEDSEFITALLIKSPNRYYAAGEVSIVPTIKPFGELPGLFDTFFIASDEAFSKKGADLTLEIKSEWADEDSIGIPIPNPVLSWEYWNGKNWAVLPVIDHTDRFRQSEKITFTGPQDIEKIEVNGEEKYWIRVRIIDGDYGKEFIIVPKVNGTTEVEFKSGKIHYPIIYSLKIDYQDIPRLPQQCFTLNNLDFSNHIKEVIDNQKTFSPFQILDEQTQSLFLGFNNKLEGGPIRILFNLIEQTLPEEELLEVQWFYWNGKKWVQLNVVDGTESLTQIGLLEFAIPNNFTDRELFDKNLFWLKGNVVTGKFVKQNDDSEDQSPKFPQIKGIFPNSVSAIQASIVQDEILGSSNLTANQEFQLLNPLVISQEVLVTEPNPPLEDERKQILEQEGQDAIKERKNELGEIELIRIRWHEVEDFFESNAKSRHYIVDKRLGIIKFGDGVKGMVPPLGTDNIRANYRYGGGRNGNVLAGKITSLKNAIPFVNEVTNHLPADGGSATETVEEVLVRGPQKLKNRDRGVTCEDFEALARNAARKVARAKCLPNTDENGEPALGHVTVIIIPDTQTADEQPTRLLRNIVLDYLQQQSTNLLSAADQIHVIGADYVEIAVEPTIVPTSLEVTTRVEEGVLSALKRYIHPLTGGSRKEGWEFGQNIYRSHLFALLEGVEGVDYVKELRIWVNGEIREGDVEIDELTLPFSGEHKVNINLDSTSTQEKPPDLTCEELQMFNFLKKTNVNRRS